MSFFKAMNISSSGLNAQRIRMNILASNLANANTVSSSADTAYRALRPVFEAEFPAFQEGSGIATVSAVDIKKSEVVPEKRYAPTHPLADPEGYIFATNVDPNEELVDMMEAARQYQNNIEVLATAKSLMIKTLSVGK